MSKYRGKLIVFEGGDGTGKSTLIDGVVFDLKSAGFIKIVRTKDPGCDTPLGREVNRKLQDKDFPMTPEEILDLFLEVRADHFPRIIIPAVRRGSIVLCDRCSDSTLAYQHYGYGIDLTKILKQDALARRNVGSDLVVLLDLDPRIGLKRKNPETRFEVQKIDFHDRVRAGYLELAKEDLDKKWFVVDASLPADQVRLIVSTKIIDFIKQEKVGRR
jgi:dTMP kinase